MTKGRDQTVNKTWMLDISGRFYRSWFITMFIQC